MNSEFVRSRAAALARRLRTETPADPGDSRPAPPHLDRLIARAWLLAYQRPISAEERDWARAFVTQQLVTMGRGGESDRALAVLTNLCQQLLTSNEFLYVD
jgi:hypothetical protein